jgi:hypothetical protein
VIGSAHGSARTCALLKEQAEDAEFFPLPGDTWLEVASIPKTNVQPDLIVKTLSVYCVVEAKRLRQSSFQPFQLAREFLLAHKAKDKTPQQLPLLFLVLSKPPPVLVHGKGRHSLQDAVATGLRDLIPQPEGVSAWQEKIDETVSWITWHEIDQIVRQNLSAIDVEDASMRASMKRLVASISDSIKRHSDNPAALRARKDQDL